MIICEIGQLGDGKTIREVYDCVDQFDRGRDVYSNVTVRGISKPFWNNNELMDVDNCLLVMDDIISWLDSRNFNLNIFESWVLLMSRKRGVDIVYSLQHNKGTDTRLRQITNILEFCDLVQFPVFRITGVGSDCKIMYRFYIEYGKDVLDLYDTRQLTIQTLFMREFADLVSICETKTIFAEMFNLRYSIPKKSAYIIYDLFYSKKFDLIRELLRHYNYKLVDEV